MSQRDIPGVRLKIRTDETSITATVWIDGQPCRELARADLATIGRPGGKAHDLFGEMVAAMLRTFLGDHPSLRTKRRKPDYEGEPKP